LLALVSYSRDAGDLAGALAYAERAARTMPQDPNLAALIGQLRQQTQGSGPR